MASSINHQFKIEEQNILVSAVEWKTNQVYGEESSGFVNNI